MHEAQLYESNQYITLTYNDENVPEDGGLDKIHLRKFWKRLRKKFPNQRLKFFACGEYGDKLGRPHYHACVFNLALDDKEPYTVRDGITLYQSKTLEKIWGKGFVTVGDVTFESAAYVARYVMKKVTGDIAEQHYMKVNLETGELVKIEPEFTSMSNRSGGIGKKWYEKYYKDTEKDFITHNGIKMKPPKYYDGLFEKRDSEQFNEVKEKRRLNALKLKKENTPERLRVKEQIKKRQLNRLKRGLSDD